MTFLDLLNIDSRVTYPVFDSSLDFRSRFASDSIFGSGSDFDSDLNSAYGFASESVLVPSTTSFYEIYSHSTV